MIIVRQSARSKTNAAKMRSLVSGTLRGLGRAFDSLGANWEALGSASYTERRKLTLFIMTGLHMVVLPSCCTLGHPSCRTVQWYGPRAHFRIRARVPPAILILLPAVLLLLAMSCLARAHLCGTAPQFVVSVPLCN